MGMIWRDDCVCGSVARQPSPDVRSRYEEVAHPRNVLDCARLKLVEPRGVVPVGLSSTVPEVHFSDGDTDLLKYVSSSRGEMRVTERGDAARGSDTTLSTKPTTVIEGASTISGNAMRCPCARDLMAWPVF